MTTYQGSAPRGSLGLWPCCHTHCPSLLPTQGSQPFWVPQKTPQGRQFLDSKNCLEPGKLQTDLQAWFPSLPSSLPPTLSLEAPDGSDRAHCEPSPHCPPKTDSEPLLYLTAPPTPNNDFTAPRGCPHSHLQPHQTAPHSSSQHPASPSAPRSHPPAPAPRESLPVLVA